MAIPACSACRFTVVNSHCWVLFCGCSITCAPVMRFADHFDMASEMNEPPIPNTAENISSACKSRSTLFSCSNESTPRILRTILRMISTAILVARKSAMRFIMPHINDFARYIWVETDYSMFRKERELIYVLFSRYKHNTDITLAKAQCTQRCVVSSCSPH